MEETKFEAIKKVFHETGMQELKPVKEKLGDNFTYKEIRLVRAVLAKEALRTSKFSVINFSDNFI